MFEIPITLARGAVAEAEEAVLDASATRLLAQPLGKAAAAQEPACAMADRACEQRAAVWSER